MIRFLLSLAMAGVGSIPTLSLAVDSPTDLYRFANLNYEYQRYESAAQKYTSFLEAAPNHSGADAAWFRLGDCYRRLDWMERAAKCFRTYLKRAPDGEYAGPAALALARHRFNQDDYEEAASFFETALNKLDDDDLEGETRFFYAQSLQYSNQKQRAREEYEALLESPRKSRFQERAELELAKLLLQEGKQKAALPYFTRLAKNAEDPVIRDEARFRAGVLNLESEEPEKAEKFLRETLENSENRKFRQIAQMALMDREYQRKNYSEVIRLYSLLPVGAKGRAKAQLDMMFANALRKKNKLAQAIRIFGQIEDEFRGTKEGKEAGYRKLLVFHEVGDKDLPRFVDGYVARLREDDPSSSYIDLALLLKGETLFEKNQYAGAAQAYSEVRIENVDPKYAAMRHYKMGWAYAESGNDDMAIDVLGEFAARWPENSLVPSALIKRAMTYYKLQDYEGALRDFRRIVKDYPGSEHLEFAMHQVALVLRHERNVKAMVKAYQALLERFPDTHVKPEAAFWIGGGLFDLKQYERCIEPLRQARELNPDDYKEKASLRLIFAHYHLERVQPLLRETDRYRVLFGEPKELIPVFGYLGRHLYGEGKLDKAEEYLELRANRRKPLETPPDIWRKLADAHLAAEEYEIAIEDLDFFLLHESHVELRARAVLDQAKCHLELGALGEGKEAAEEVLRLIRKGRLNAEARLMLGDLAMAGERPAEAVQHYVIVAEFGGDEIMVARALHRLVEALEAQGKSDAAAEYRNQLDEDFPNFDPEE